mmetsp:Transcript_19636/g.41353  ORF Transcript_19636/g.41353 Transcript_19636/m.41353 type:complete len:106 (+) Transcript_19636:78-395(+)
MQCCLFNANANANANYTVGFCDPGCNKPQFKKYIYFFFKTSTGTQSACAYATVRYGTSAFDIARTIVLRTKAGIQLISSSESTRFIPETSNVVVYFLGGALTRID